MSVYVQEAETTVENPNKPKKGCDAADDADTLNVSTLFGSRKRDLQSNLLEHNSFCQLFARALKKWIGTPQNAGYSRSTYLCHVGA